MNYPILNHQNTTFSQLRSTTANDLHQSNIGSQHNLPHITQPILAKYRSLRMTSDIIVQQSSSLFCRIFSIAPKKVSLCKCDRSQQGLCNLVIKWVNEYYDWKSDIKFVKAYHSYSRRNIEVFLTDSDIERRLSKKLQILGVRLGQKQRNLLIRVCKNYLKHTNYYGKSQQLSKQNDLWMWFAIGIYYHIGSSINTQFSQDNRQEQLLFWSLDIIMNRFGNLTRPVFQKHITKIMELMRDYFPKWFIQITQQYAIDLEPIIYEWINQLMMGYMGIECIGFFIDCLIKTNPWNYVYKIFLSYLEKRMQKMDSDQIFKSVTDRQVITKQLLNGNEQWPLIFCNANSFCFDKENSITTEK